MPPAIGHTTIDLSIVDDDSLTAIIVAEGVALPNTVSRDQLLATAQQLLGQPSNPEVDPFALKPT